jgi:hypothetical protein
MHETTIFLVPFRTDDSPEIGCEMRLSNGAIKAHVTFRACDIRAIAEMLARFADDYDADKLEVPVAGV